jgi:ribonuclease J
MFKKTRTFRGSIRSRKKTLDQFKKRLQLRVSQKSSLRIIPLGGLEEVGRNMTLLEYGQDVIIVDMGLQFPEEDMPGIDYIIPNISYLKGKEQNIRGVFITHGHYDHIGAIPHLIPQLGNPWIYAGDLTRAMIEKRQEEYQDKPKLRLKTINSSSKIKAGVFQVEFFKVSHNIPNAFGLIIRTPEGIVVHTGDFKIDFNPVGAEMCEFAKIAQLNDQNVLALLSDSTNAFVSGHQLSEKEIEKTLEEVLLKIEGRIIIATFASLLSRVQQIIELAEKMDRKVFVDGRSMKTNVEIAQQTGYLKIKKGTLISIEEANRLPPNKVLILCTGAQGEERAVLMRLALGEHKRLKITEKDTVIFSSSAVPGNERTVQRVKDNFYKKGAEVIHYQMLDVHTGGHAKEEELKLMLRMVNPKYVVPIEGNLFMLKAQAKIAEVLGFNPRNILVASNGQIIEFSRGLGKLTNQRVSTDYIMVDGLGVGDVSHVVLRDRNLLASDGMVVVIATIENKTGKLIGSPDIISRGFVYMKESKELIEMTRKKVIKLLKDTDPRSEANEVYLKNKIRDSIGQYLFSKTERRPMILPVIIGV